MADDDCVKASATAPIITFGLHPGRTLRCTLHAEVQNPASVASAARSYRGGEGDAEEAGRFAIADARRFISLRQMAVAGNAALLRAQNRRRRDGSGGSVRGGIALETLICGAGTSHPGNAMRDYAFISPDGGGGNGSGFSTNDSTSNPGNGVSPPLSKATVLALGYDCKTDEEYEAFLERVGLADCKRLDPSTYFARKRDDGEERELIKLYKLTREEIDMSGSSLEHAVLTRIATKFIT